MCPESNAQISFHNCSMTIFNYLKIVHELNQKSMSDWLLFYMRLFLLIFGSYPCYWTVFSWKKETKYVYSVGTYSLETLFCLWPAQSCGGTETRHKWFLSANSSAYSHGPLTNVAPKRRTGIISFEYFGVKYHLFAAFRILQNPFYGNLLTLGLFNSTR